MILIILFAFAYSDINVSFEWWAWLLAFLHLVFGGQVVRLIDERKR